MSLRHTDLQGSSAAPLGMFLLRDPEAVSRIGVSGGKLSGPDLADLCEGMVWSVQNTRAVVSKAATSKSEVFDE